MASQSETTQTRSVMERLIATRNRDLSLFLPFLLGIHGPESGQTTPDPDHSSSNGSDPESQTDRIILINPYTQAMVVIERETLASLLMADVTGPPPASKASIEALESVEVGEDESGECVICLEEWRDGGGCVKEMDCKHRFHGGCLERWLGIHGSCPVCRFEMKRRRPCDLGDRGVWVSFSFGGRVVADRSSDGDRVEEVINGSGENEISGS